MIAATSLGTETVANVLVDSGANLEATAVFGARPLHWAASVGLPSTVELLIQHGAELEARCMEFGATPLYWAVFGFGQHGPNRKGDPLESARVLLNAGASIDTTNKQGISLLECSQQAQSNEMYELLIRCSKEP
ncbi:MAG: ankyrin repeat domain-containing protein [Thermoanaerobaculia bacterium]|nr:ankyrin repeat domain-containing protein [Thermoanaerobaculia bacterium]